MNAVVPSGGLNVAPMATADIFETEAGLVNALAVLRQAAMAPEAKSQLRDLFLNYVGESEGSKRGILKEAITTELKKHPSLSSLVPNQPAPSASAVLVTSSAGFTRPTPAFGAPMTKTMIATPEPIVSAVTPAERPAPTMNPLPPTAAPTSTALSEAPTVATPPVATPSVPITTPATAAVPSTVAAETPALPSASTQDDPRQRISAIKHDINSQIGNPVNLISANEKVGREYMSALLEAMKKVSQGAGAESLTRLETAYQAATDLIKQQGLSSATPATEVMAKTEAASAPISESKKPNAAEADASFAAVPVEPEIIPSPIASVEPTPAEPTAAIIPPPAPPTQSEGLYHRPADELEAEPTTPDPSLKLGLSSLAGRLFKGHESNDPEKPPVPLANTVPTGNVRKVSVQNMTVPASTDPVPTDNAIADEKLTPLRQTATTLPEQMATLKAAATKREAEAKKPITDLNAPEIDAGLRQLLAEWSLFRKSGLFGTGPAGIDHPLYKQLSVLPMAAVVSGRFEGVTPEIKRRLSDYMTGWRYEQGIVHEMGETFEHYLRRVIRQILQKQRKIPGA